jgi:hypothetical protein
VPGQVAALLRDFAVRPVVGALMGARALASAAQADGASTTPQEERAYCDLLREVVPFRLVRVRHAWLRFGDGCVTRLARAVADEGRFEDLPVLADALEDAGCADALLLGHLRSPGPHLRACWAVDAILDARCV